MDGLVSEMFIFWVKYLTLPLGTGFDCRCGNLFCAIHRYSDKHDCPYDYRGAAAARIRKENPIVVAEKIQKLWGLRTMKKIEMKTNVWPASLEQWRHR